MQNFSLLKQEFLEEWIEGLKTCNSSRKSMGIMERKNAIKRSADLAMAFARRGTTSWSRAVIAKASSSQRFIFRSKKIVKRSNKYLRRTCGATKALPSSIMAKRLVRKRTQALRRLLPGSDQCLDEASLVREALDYIISLKAQADVMRSCLDRATSSKLVQDK